MFSKGVWVTFVVCCSVMVMDRYNFLLAAAIVCGILSYTLTSSAIKWWLIGVYIKFQNTPIKLLRHRRKRVVTLSLEFLQPAIEKLIIFLNSKSTQGQDKSRLSVAHGTYESKTDVSDGEHSSCVFGAFCGQTPSRTEEIKTFVHDILFHFVSYWYKDISSNSDFTVDVEYVLEETLTRTCDRISRLNVHHLMHQMLILYRNHILVNSQLVQKENRTKRKSANYEEYETHRDGHISSELHTVLKDAKSETWYLTNVCEILMDLLGMEEVLQCPLVHFAIRDILAQNMFLPLVNLISDPVWLYWAICYTLGDGELVSEPMYNNVSSKSKESASNTLPSIPQHRKTLDVIRPLHCECVPKRSLSCCSLSSSLNGNEGLSDSSAIKVIEGKEKMNVSCSSDPLLVSADIKQSDLNILTEPTVLVDLLQGTNVHKDDNIFLENCKKPSLLKHSRSLESALSRSADNVSSCHKNASLALTPKSASLPRAVSSVDVEQALEVVEGDDNKLFRSVSIVGTEERLDTKRRSYTLYCIKYEISSKVTNAIEASQCYAKKTGIVLRRFKEFMALQERLEGHPELRKYLKGVKGPSKWLAAPFSKLDRKNIEARRFFLQEYLRKLCSRPELSNSHELRQFLAYRGDASIAFVKKAPVPRFDKAVLRGLMGALDIIKTALPHLPQEMPSADLHSPNGEKNSSVRSLLTGFRKNRTDGKDFEIELVYGKEGVGIEEMIYNYLDRMLTSSPDDSVTDSPATPSESIRLPTWKRAIGSLHSIVSHDYRSEGDGCDSEELAQRRLEWDQKNIDKLQEAVEKEIPLADVVFDLVLQLLPPTRFISDDNFVLSFKIVFGQIVQRWLQKALFVDEETWVKYLHKIHEALWPSEPPQPHTESEDLLQKYRSAAFEAIRSLAPGNLTKIYAASEIDHTLNVWLDCLSNVQRNKSLVYQIMDVLLDMLCAQEIHRNPFYC